MNRPNPGLYFGRPRKPFGQVRPRGPEFIQQLDFGAPAPDPPSPNTEAEAMTQRLRNGRQASVLCAPKRDSRAHLRHHQRTTRVPATPPRRRREGKQKVSPGATRVQTQAHSSPRSDLDRAEYPAIPDPLSRIIQSSDRLP